MGMSYTDCTHFLIIRRFTQSQAVLLEAMLLLVWLLFCYLLRFAALRSQRHPIWFRLRWWISRFDFFFSTQHWLEDNKVIVKRKTELGGTFYVASWILFVGLLSALLYQVITKRSIEYFTGVHAVVDLACMRDAMNRLGGDSNKINPLLLP